MIMNAIAEAERQLAGRGRVLLRASGTEPLVRVMVEGDNCLEVQQIADSLSDLVRS